MFIVPFNADELKKIISGEVKNLMVDYPQSTIKGRNFITYFSNLKYKNIEVNFDGVGVDERKELLVEYIKHQSTVQIVQVEAAMLKAVLCYKGYQLKEFNSVELDKTYFDLSLLTDEEILLFVGENKDLVKTLVEILDGTLLYAINNLNHFKQHYSSVTENIVVEKQEIGKTFVNLFQNEIFNSYYYSILSDFSQLKYFEHYFDRPIYSGQTLLPFISGQCVIFPLLKMILDGAMNMDDFNKIKEETPNATPL